MKQFEFTIKDELGIHARPAGMLAKLAKSFESDITITKGDKTVNAGKLIALMGMGIKCNDTITICIDGADEEQAAVEIENFLNENL